MSHTPERQEKDCLNCGTLVQGKYCHKCGQPNVIPRESFWAMITHFVYDITHFDGKFFDTVRIMLRKPGFLSLEYIKGRRASYLNPVRMYVFTSAFFFLVFFSISKTSVNTDFIGNNELTPAAREKLLKRIESGRYTSEDSADLAEMTKLLRDTTRTIFETDVLVLRKQSVVMSTINGFYKSRAHYDSIQRSLPSDKKDGWLVRAWNKRATELNEKYANDPAQSWQRMLDVFVHKLPYMLFVSLPFFALLLKLLYYRHKNLYFVDHGIFTIHHYVVSFVMLLLMFLFNRLNNWTGWSIWNFLTLASFLAVPFYLYKGMRRFYGQSRWKTILKFLLICFLGLILMTFLFVVFMILTALDL